MRVSNFVAIAMVMAVSGGIGSASGAPTSCKQALNAPAVRNSSGLPFCASLSPKDNELGKACALRTSFDITREMGTGWNLGNTMDALDEETGSPSDETLWGNPRASKANIDKLRELGMNTLRLPVSWDNHVRGPDWAIDKEWLDRVEEIASYALDNGMYVIVNVHHNNGWEAPTYENEAHAKDILVKLWRQIAQRFKAYEHRLIFETMNEPHVKLNGKEDWVGKSEYYEVVNRLNSAALAAIRTSGGNNARRLVMLPTYAAAGGQAQLDAFMLPADSMIALSTHAYMPYQFAQNPTGTAVFYGEESIDQLFNRLSCKFIQNGVPVVMGEWGSTHKNNLPERVRQAAYYVKSAKHAGIPTIVWDNGILPPLLRFR